MIRFTAQMRTYGPNVREHWRARSRRVKSERQIITAHLLAQGARPPLPVRVTFTRLSSAEMDDDNVRGAMKGARDAIAAWLGVDDRRGSGIEWAYNQERAPRGYHAVRVCIEPVAANSSHDPTNGGAT